MKTLLTHFVLAFISSKAGLLTDMASKVKCYQIVALKKSSVSYKNIMKQLNVCRKTVFNIWKRYKAFAITFNKSILGRKRSIRPTQTVETM